MRDSVKRPLLVAAAALALIIVVELATAGMSDEGAGSDVRFIAQVILVLVLVVGLVMAAINAVRSRS